MHLLPDLTGPIEAGACDWAMERKGRAASFREGMRGKKRTMRWGWGETVGVGGGGRERRRWRTMRWKMEQTHMA